MSPLLMNRYARVAGALYLTIIVTSILSLFLIETRLVVEDDWAETTRRVAANPTLFRAGLAYDTAMFAAVVALAWALFVLLRTVNRELALLGLLFRLAEAIIGAVTVLLGILVALLVGSPSVRESFEPGQLHAWVDVLMAARSVGFDVTIFFLSLGTLVFCRLLYTSRYIPRTLAALGVVSFIIMPVGVVLSLVWPRYHDLSMVGWAPGIVFEVTIGLWLLLRGVRIPPSNEVKPELATVSVA